MSDPTGAVSHATDAGFATRVLARSQAEPVLVDFWAAWSGPCRALGSVLERIAASEAGRVAVVKLDTDANPEVARRYEIRSIPEVKLFHRSEVVAEFVGALPEAQIRAVLAALADDRRQRPPRRARVDRSSPGRPDRLQRRRRPPAQHGLLQLSAAAAPPGP